MQTVVTVVGSELSVTLDEAKAHLRVVSGDLDIHIQSLLEAATDYCESVTGRSLRVSQTLAQTYRSWPCNPVRFDRQPVLENVPESSPVETATVVQYYDADDVLQTVDEANYRLHRSTHAAAYLEFDGDFTQPALAERDDAVTITYLAGYGSVASVPAKAKPAILLTLELLFGNLDSRDYANVERSRNDCLGSLDWGCYR